MMGWEIRVNDRINNNMLYKSLGNAQLTISEL